MRGHEPVIIEEFNGLWKRGDADACPPDHFTDCNNIAFLQSGFRTRDGIGGYFTDPTGIPNAVRMYTFVQESGQSLLTLDNSGNIWDVQGQTIFGPILSIGSMTDFGFVSMNGRAYITPCDGITGLAGEFVYVYAGNGTLARKAAGAAPTNADGALAATNSAVTGDVETGVHVFGAVYETDTGFLTSIGPDTLPSVIAPGLKKVSLSNIPISPNSYVTNVHIVATKAINPATYHGDTTGYQFYFVPGAVVTNGTTTLDVSFFDSELLDSADHLFDLFEEIPATVGLNTYHQRMIAYTTATDISLCYVSEPGEPEAINQISGLIVFPLDGAPITNGQEFRDVLYLFKQTKTNAWTDNGDDPSSWPLTILDQGIGASVHGIATVLDSGGVNVDYLDIVDYSGIFLFNGAYIRPELSWKIKDLWDSLARDFFLDIEIKNDSLTQQLYITLPDRTMLVGDYTNGLDPVKIRWTPWSFDVEVNTIALINTNTLVIGSTDLVP